MGRCSECLGPAEGCFYEPGGVVISRYIDGMLELGEPRFYCLEHVPGLPPEAAEPPGRTETDRIMFGWHDSCPYCGGSECAVDGGRICVPPAAADARTA